MTEEQNSGTPGSTDSPSAYQADAPPTLEEGMPPVTVLKELPPRWHKPIGILNIVFGIIGVLFGTLGLVSLMFMAKLMELSAKNNPEFAAQIQDIDWSIMRGIPAVTLAAVGIFWSFILFISGIMVLRKSRNARFTSILWAVVRIILFAIVVINMYRVTPQWIDHLQGLTAQGNQMAERMIKQSNLNLQVITGAIFSLPYPIFMLIWFLRPKIARQCAEW